MIIIITTIITDFFKIFECGIQFFYVNIQKIVYCVFQGYLLPDDIDDGKTHFGEDENKDRGNWSGKLVSA